MLRRRWFSGKSKKSLRMEKVGVDGWVEHGAFRQETVRNATYVMHITAIFSYLTKYFAALIMCWTSFLADASHTRGRCSGVQHWYMCALSQRAILLNRLSVLTSHWHSHVILCIFMKSTRSVLRSHCDKLNPLLLPNNAVSQTIGSSWAKVWYPASMEKYICCTSGGSHCVNNIYS